MEACVTKQIRPTLRTAKRLQYCLTNRSRASSSRSAPENLDKAIAILREHDVPFQQLGKVGGDELQIRIDEQTFRWRVAEIYDEWWNAIRRAVEQDESIPSL